MALKSIVRKPGQIFYGWRIVAACSAFLGLAMSFGGAARSVLFLPIAQELSLSRAGLSLVFSIAQAEGSVLSAVTGWLIDRRGPRFMMMMGATIAGVGYLLLSQTQNYLSFMLVYLAFVTVGIQFGELSPVLAAINTWFRRHRALAMSIVTASAGAGAFIVPIYSYVVLNFSWRWAVTMAGLVMIVLVAPLALVVRRSPESMGLRPDGDATPEKAEAAGGPGARAARRAVSEETDFTVREAIRAPAFWMMVMAMALRFFGRGVMGLHFIPILVWRGMEQQQAAYVMGVMLFWLLPSRPLVGWLADRFSKAKLLAFGMVLWTLSPLLLLYGEASWVPWVAATAYGLGEGFPPTHHALFGDYFGRKNFATLRGLSYSITSPFSMVAPFVAGLLFDRTQSYELVLILTAAFWTACGLFYFLLRAPAKPRRAEVPTH